MIDAAGRGPRWLAPHGARRRIFDRLCCAWMRTSRAALPAGVVHIEAEAEGWRYAAPIPDGGIVAFHTDADLPAARAGRTLPTLLARARAAADARPPARGPMLGRGRAWLLRGAYGLGRSGGRRDMADRRRRGPSFDPLAAQGIFAALYLGLAAAERRTGRWMATRRRCRTMPGSRVHPRCIPGPKGGMVRPRDTMGRAAILETPAGRAASARSSIRLTADGI